MSDTDILRQSLISLGLLPNPNYDNIGGYPMPEPPEDPRVEMLWGSLSFLSRRFMFLEEELTRTVNEARDLRGKLAKARAFIDHVEAACALEDLDQEVLQYVREYTAS